MRLRRGPQDAPRDIQVPLAPSGSRRVIPFAATVLRSLALLRYRSRASSHNDLTPLQGYRGLLASVFDLPWLVGGRGMYNSWVTSLWVRSTGLLARACRARAARPRRGP